MDLFQRLHHLCQTGATQLTEQGLRAGWEWARRGIRPGQPSHPLTLTPHRTPTRLSSLTVGEEDVCGFVGEGRGPPEICDQGLYRLGKVDHSPGLAKYP